MENLLLISKNSGLVTKLCDPLKNEGFNARQVDSCDAALNILNSETYSSIFADKQTLTISEYDFIDLVKKINSSTKVVFFNAAEENALPLKFWTMQCFSFDESESLLQKVKLIFEQGENTLKTYLEKRGYSSKQIKILLMIARGECNKAIAQELRISEQGVKYHVGILLKDFQKTNRKELQKYLSEISL